MAAHGSRRQLTSLAWLAWRKATMSDWEIMEVRRMPARTAGSCTGRSLGQCAGGSYAVQAYYHRHAGRRGEARAHEAKGAWGHSRA